LFGLPVPTILILRSELNIEFAVIVVLRLLVFGGLSFSTHVVPATKVLDVCKSEQAVKQLADNIQSLFEGSAGVVVRGK
jgi:hypothetical protein